MQAKEVARLLGVRPEAVSVWEHGKRPVDPWAWSILATVALDRSGVSSRIEDRLEAYRSTAKRPREVPLADVVQRRVGSREEADDFRVRVINVFERFFRERENARRIYKNAHRDAAKGRKNMARLRRGWVPRSAGVSREIYEARRVALDAYAETNSRLLGQLHADLKEAFPDHLTPRGWFEIRDAINPADLLDFRSLSSKDPDEDAPEADDVESSPPCFIRGFVKAAAFATWRLTDEVEFRSTLRRFHEASRLRHRDDLGQRQPP